MCRPCWPHQSGGQLWGDVTFLCTSGMTFSVLPVLLLLCPSCTVSFVFSFYRRASGLVCLPRTSPTSPWPGSYSTRAPLDPKAHRPCSSTPRPGPKPELELPRRTGNVLGGCITYSPRLCQRVQLSNRPKVLRCSGCPSLNHVAISPIPAHATAFWFPV